MTTQELQALIDRAKACGAIVDNRAIYSDNYWLNSVFPPDIGAMDALHGDVIRWIEARGQVWHLAKRLDGKYEADCRTGLVHPAALDNYKTTKTSPTALHALVELAEMVKGATV